MDSEKLHQKVWEVCRECGIKDFPFDCIAILEHYGFKIFTYERARYLCPELYVLCRDMSDDAFSDKVLKVILYNDSLCIQRIRFSLMHELGHYILGHNIKSKEFEREADAFAANLLAPEAVIKYQGFYSAPSLSNYFGISIAAANYVMMNMKMRSFWSLDRYEAKLLASLYPSSSRIYFNESGNVACVRLGNVHYSINGKSDIYG